MSNLALGGAHEFTMSPANQRVQENSQ